MKIIIFCLIAITLVSSPFASSEAPSDKKQSASPQYKCKGTALCISGKITKIIDGDTIYLKDYKIRLSLTDTPEKGKKGFKDATYFTKKLCPLGSTITVDQDDKQPYDKYKRVVGKVICSGKVLNSKLLYNGHANILKQYCSKSEFSGEAWAQKYGCETKTQELKQQIQKESNTYSTPTPTKENQCDPSYPTMCIPSPPPDLDCGDIEYSNFKVLPPDPHNFDGDKDGIGCEKSTSSQPPTSVPPTPTKENRCDSSYPDVCIPPYPPDLDCGDIPYRNFRVLPPDPHRFDGDKDGIGCER